MNNSTLLSRWNTSNAASLLEEHTFYPDVKAYTRVGSEDEPVYQYYDETIPNQVAGYQSTQAPAEVQLDFYTRDSNGSAAVDLSQHYLMDLDWDDGSEKSFRDSPHRLGPNQKVTHQYKQSGFYSITGYVVKKTGADRRGRNLLPRNGAVAPGIQPGDPDTDVGTGSKSLNDVYKWLGNPGPTDYVIRQVRHSTDTEYEIDIDGIESGKTYTFSMWIGIPQGMSERHVFHGRIYAQNNTNTVYVGGSSWDANSNTSGYTGKLVDVYTDGTITWEYRHITRTAPEDATGRWTLHIGSGMPANQIIYYTGFRLEQTEEQTAYNPVYFKRFRLNIFLNDNPAQLNEFTQLGGSGYLTLPYQHTTPIVGGISKRSLYYRTVRRLAGKPNELKFLRYSDRLRLQKEAVKLDETLSDLPTIQQFENKDHHRGFLKRTDPDGNVLYGAGEFGEGLNNTDLGQVRLFNSGVVSIEEMLGFNSEDQDARTPGKIRYWRNHIPAGYNLGNRTGVAYQNDKLESIDPQDDQTWLDGSYYPVLPKVNQYGRFDETLGNQIYSDIEESEEYNSTEYGSSDAPIMKKTIQHENLILDVDVSKITNKTSEDLSGKNNTGFHINDYKIVLDSQDRLEKQDLPLATKTNADSLKGAY